MNGKILLTGANGLLGQKLVEWIVSQQKYALVATGRGQNRLPNQASYIYETLDITSQAEVEAIIQKHAPTVVIHAAAMTNVDACELQKEEAWLQNTTATKYIAQACAKYNAFLVHLSTDFIFDGKTGPLSEDAKPYPVSFYGYTKLVAEEIIQNMPNLKWSIARTVLVYGIAHDMSRTNIILWVKKSLEDKKNIKVVDDQWRSPTLAEDLAKGCYLIADQKAEGIFNISGKDFLNPYQMAMKVVDYFKLDASYITKADSTTFVQPAIRPAKTGFIIDKAIQVLGYQPHSFDEGIEILASQMK